MDGKYTFEDLKHIVEVLRGENGCPWDRKQTHESLKPCMMEEAAELVSSIRIYDKTGNAENMREELGDSIHVFPSFSLRFISSHVTGMSSAFFPPAFAPNTWG